MKHVLCILLLALLATACEDHYQVAIFSMWNGKRIDVPEGLEPTKYGYSFTTTGGVVEIVFEPSNRHQPEATNSKPKGQTP